jgi:hypothetical protein
MYVCRYWFVMCSVFVGPEPIISGQYSSIEVANPAMVVASPTRLTYIARGINVMDRFTNWIRTAGLTSAVQVSRGYSVWVEPL